MIPRCLLTCDVLPIFCCEQLRKGWGSPLFGCLVWEEALRGAVSLQNVVVLWWVLKSNHLPAVCFLQLPRLPPSHASTLCLRITGAFCLGAFALCCCTALPLSLTQLSGFLCTPAGQLGATIPLPGRLSSVSLWSSHWWPFVLFTPRLCLHFTTERDGRSLR